MTEKLFVPARKREPLSSLVLYYLFKSPIIDPVFYLYLRGRLYGLEKVPKQSPVVIVSNHGSYFDPPLLGASMNRPVAFMAKKELFEVPLLKQGIKLYGAYPVNREAFDRQAIRAAIHSMEQGWSVGLFLDGTRTPDGRIHEPKLGAALISAKTQVPLLPVSIWGSEKILLSGSPVPRSVPVTIRVGDLIDPPHNTKREQLESVTQVCASAINQLHSLGR